MAYNVDFGGVDLTVNTLSTGVTGPGKAGTGTNIATSFTTNQVNLNAGTATVAPLVLASGTKLTTAAAGAVEFDGTAFYATAVNSARQQLDAEQFFILAANSSTYNNTGLDAATTPVALFASGNGGTGNGAVTLVGGKTYMFEAMYNLTNTGTTSHTWQTLFGGTATFSTGTIYQMFGISGTSANNGATGGVAGFSTTLGTAAIATNASTSATEQASIELIGTIVVNAGGTLIPQLQASARPGASGTPGVIFLAGSFFRIWEMSGTGSVGNWS